MSEIRAWQVAAAGQKLEQISYEPGPLGDEEVEIAVEYCGLCHSDLSVLKNEWGNSKYPAVLGHEAVGRITAMGDHVKGDLKIGQCVGVGWNSGSCMYCDQCLSGRQNLCSKTQATIIGHRGGFAERMRAHWAWTIPLPENLDASSAGPLLCGGITVFEPFMVYDIKATDKVGVVGIGGLGHMALQFAAAWGCEVTAFTSTESKTDDARGFGAHKVVSSTDSKQIEEAANSLDLLLVTANASLDWSGMMGTLRPTGRMHIVGAIPKPIQIKGTDLISGRRSVSGSPTGAPVEMNTMLEFVARHGIAPKVEHFPMSKINEAFEHLEAGKARYRVVLDADF